VRSRAEARYDVPGADVRRQARAQQEREREMRCVFRPGESTLLEKWDVLGAIALLYTAIVTPFDVAYLPEILDNPFMNGRFIANRVVDLYFAMDLCAQFFISVRPLPSDLDKNADAFDASGMTWIDDRRIIARRYLCSGNFVFDISTLLPSIFDMAFELSGASNSAAGNVTAIRMLRIFRFVKILRLTRLQRLRQRWAARFTIKHSTASLINCVMKLLMSAHWFACIISLSASMHVEATDTLWGPHAYAFCAAGEVITTEMEQAGYIFCPGLTVGNAYIASLTWSLMIITGTGGTDFYPSPYSIHESMLVLVLVLIGALLWTEVLATFCDVATNSDPEGVRFRQLLDDTTNFLELHELGTPLGRRVREFLYAKRECQQRLETTKVVRHLSPALQVEVIMETQKTFFSRVRFLRAAEEACCVQVALAMSSGVFAPGELAHLLHMYVLERGLAYYNGRIMIRGTMWGEQDVILPDGLVKYANLERARAMTYMEYNGISRDALLTVIERFPSTKARLRRTAIWIALSRHMVSSARMELRRRRMDGNAPARTGSDFLSYLHKAVVDEGDRMTKKALAADAVQEGTSPAPVRPGHGAGTEHGAGPASVRALETKISETRKVLERRLGAMERLAEERHAALTKLADERHAELTQLVRALSQTGVTAGSRRPHRSPERLRRDDPGTPDAASGSRTRRSATTRGQARGHCTDTESDAEFRCGSSSGASRRRAHLQQGGNEEDLQQGGNEEDLFVPSTTPQPWA